jgi:hypothetical protein
MAENSRDIRDDRKAPIFAAVRFTDQQLDDSSDALILVQVVAALAGREAHEAIEATYWNGLEGTPIVDPHGDARQIQLLLDHMAAYLLGAAGTDTESPAMPK